MNNNYFCHVIRDLFPKTTATICYGDNCNLVDTLRTPVHGIGALMLHTEYNKSVEEEYSHMWDIGINGCYFGDQFCDLFISVDYNPLLNGNNYDYMAAQIKNLVRLNGFLFLVNPGLWASSISKYFLLREDLVKEAKRYSFLKNDKVYIYENIRLFNIL